MKHSIQILTIGMALFLAVIGCHQQTPEQTGKQSFDKEWSFSRGDHPGAHQPGFTDSAWRVLDLPHDWSVEPLPGADGRLSVGPFSPGAEGGPATGHTTGGMGWYRKQFITPLTGERHTFYFEGIYMESEIWVNGVRAGFHPYGYTSFSIDVTGLLQPAGHSNLVAVRVTSPGRNSRWYAGSGIYRHVWLLSTPSLHLDPWHAHIQTEHVNGDHAMISMMAEILNSGTARGKGTLDVRIISPDGRKVSRERLPVRVEPDSLLVINREFSIEGAESWSPGSPALYSARLVLRRGLKRLHAIIVPFGIRTVSFSPEEGFLLNGSPLELKGGCIHHDNGVLGSASIDRAEYRKVELLKSAGFNAVRCAHNPPAEKFLEACDRLGLLVIDEAFDQWRLKKNEMDYHRYFDEWHEEDLTSMVRRDRNHPSIIMWSIGNEIEERADTSGMEIARELKGIIRTLDTTRPVTAAVNTFWDRPRYSWADSERAFRNLDVCGYNYAWWEYENDHASFPERIIYGSESVPRETSQNWDLVEELPYVIGDFVWTALDYLGESGIGHTEYSRPGDPDTTFFRQWPWFVAWCGDIDLCGNLKPQGLYRKVVWGESPVEMVVHAPVPDGMEERYSYWGWPDEIPSWNWRGSEGKPMEARVFTRAPRVRLLLNGEPAGEKETDTEGPWKYTALFRVPYQPGILRAVALSDNLPLGGRELRTTGEVTGIRLRTADSVIFSDPNDLSYIAIELVDRDGNIVPDRDIRLDLSVSGPAGIAASGNASPVDMESFRSLSPKTFLGRALVILRPTGKPGQTTLTATPAEKQGEEESNQVQESTLTIQIQKGTFRPRL